MGVFFRKKTLQVSEKVVILQPQNENKELFEKLTEADVTQLVE